jgi:hypothetical protein
VLEVFKGNWQSNRMPIPFFVYSAHTAELSPEEDHRLIQIIDASPKERSFFTQLETILHQKGFTAGTSKKIHNI